MIFCVIEFLSCVHR